MPVFEKGEKCYFELMNISINAAEIVQTLEKDIKRTEEEVKKLKEKKEFKVKELLELCNNSKRPEVKVL